MQNQLESQFSSTIQNQLQNVLDTDPSELLYDFSSTSITFDSTIITFDKTQ